MLKLGVLGSTRGTHLFALIDAISHKHVQASIEIVISNKQEAGILKRAQDFGLLNHFLNPNGFSREAYDEEISALLHQHNVDLIILIGFMRILSNTFVSKWKNKIINIHPSLLPRFAGKMDLSVHQAVLDAKEKETGCTVHYVTEDLDAGPILLQKRCAVMEHDTAEILKERVQKLEAEALVEVINSIIKFNLF